MVKVVYRMSFIQPPRYSQIAAKLANDIDEGLYPVGSILPTESELQAQYGVSRHTVREALRELKELGLISSKSGVGTHVRARPRDQRFIHGVSSLDQLLQIVESTEQQVLDWQEVSADQNLARLLNCNVGRKWLQVVTLRSVSTQSAPIGMVTIYIPPEHQAVIPKIETEHKPVFFLIEQMGGARVAEIRQEIAPANLDKHQATVLGASERDNALMIIRHHMNEHDEVIQASVGLYPKGRSSYVTRFRVHRGTAV